MGDVQVANRPVSKYQNSYLALWLRGTTQKKWILESQCPFFSFTPLSLEAQYELNNNIWKRPSIQCFWNSQIHPKYRKKSYQIQHIWNLSWLSGLFNCRKLANLSWNLVTTMSTQCPKTTRRKLCCEKLGTSHDVKSFAIGSFFEHFVDKIANDYFC